MCFFDKKMDVKALEEAGDVLDLIVDFFMCHQGTVYYGNSL